MAAPRRRRFPEVLAPERPGGRVAGGGPRAGSLPRAARPLRLPRQQPRPGAAATCRLRRRALGLPLDAAAGSEDATRHRRLPGTPPRWLTRIVNHWVYPPVIWIMQARMLAVLKRNVERTGELAAATPPSAEPVKDDAA